MYICPRCNKSHDPEDRFCGFCGYNLTVQNDSNFVTKQAIKVVDMQYNLGILYYKDGKYSQAVEIFEKILDEHPDNLQAINMYERACNSLNESSEESSS